MTSGYVWRGAAALLFLVATSAFAAPAGPAHLVPALRAHATPAQANPPAPEPGAAPDAAAPPVAQLPPPILPAPKMPDGEPLVTLPPKSDAAQTPSGSPAAPNSFADVAAQLLDSVVYISTSQRVAVPHKTQAPPKTSPDTSPDASPDTPPDAPPGEDFFDDFFGNNNGDAPDAEAIQSLGSGFVIDPSGLIVTNNHVIADADQILANFANGDKFEAKVVGIDDKTDLALLKITPNAPLKAAKFGRSENLRVGDWVLAIGNPFGFGGSVTAGIVSALDRDINSGPYDHYIQTDASINRGNSGGPLFNMAGEVVGINTAIMSPTGGSIGIGFSVPSEIAVPVIEQLRRFGEVRRGWIGVRIQDVTDDVASSLGMEKAVGAFIAGMTAEGPAAKAGMKQGDVVIEFNGKTVGNIRALPRLVADTPPGDTVEVVVMRDGKRVTLSIEVGLLKDELVEKASAEPDDNQSPDQPPEDLAQMFGLSLGAITDDARKTFSLDDSVEGVLVTAVDPGSEAEQKNLKPGEVIVQVSQTDVTKPEDVVARMEELKAAGRRTVMLLVSGADDKLRFVSLRFEGSQ